MSSREKVNIPYKHVMFRREKGKFEVSAPSSVCLTDKGGICKSLSCARLLVAAMRLSLYSCFVC